MEIYFLTFAQEIQYLIRFVQRSVHLEHGTLSSGVRCCKNIFGSGCLSYFLLSYNEIVEL